MSQKKNRTAREQRRPCVQFGRAEGHDEKPITSRKLYKIFSSILFDRDEAESERSQARVLHVLFTSKIEVCFCLQFPEEF